MNKEQSVGKEYQRGTSVLEAVIAFGLLTIALSGIILLFFGSQNLIVDKNNSVRARILTQEGLEAARAIAKNNWADLVDGQYGLLFSTSTWQFSSSSDQTDIFTRTITVTTTDSYTKKIISKVTWQIEPSRPQRVELETLLTKWSVVLDQGGGPGSGDTGLSGDWQNPQSCGQIDLGPGQSGTGIDLLNNIAYLSSVASDNKKPDLNTFSVASPCSPQALGNINVGSGLNGVAVTGTRAFGVSGDNTDEIVVINVANPSQMATSTFVNLTGNADALSVFIDGDFLYVGRAAANDSDEFYILNIQNPQNLSIVSSLEIGYDVNDVFVIDNRAYLAIANPNQELIIVNVQNPGSPQILGNFNAATTDAGQSVFVQRGPRVFLGTQSTLYVLNADVPTNIIQRGTYQPGGVINDLLVVGKYIFLATSISNKEFIVLNGKNPDNLTLIGEFNYPQVATGIAYQNNLVITSVRSNDALRVITSQ